MQEFEALDGFRRQWLGLGTEAVDTLAKRERVAREIARLDWQVLAEGCRMNPVEQGTIEDLIAGCRISRPSHFAFCYALEGLGELVGVVGTWRNGTVRRFFLVDADGDTYRPLCDDVYPVGVFPAVDTRNDLVALGEG